MKKYLPKIDRFETGFINGRYIGENIRLIQENIEKLENETLSGLLILADFEKAFDSISHSIYFTMIRVFLFLGQT